ncbi:hypothetical protein SEA_BLINN1_43 [Mycobacterium phage Blinn1]|uniref:Uncharacterized protein n=1 Tax=Mycobacterium phage Blinn1 TaxID=2656562 RepID=A0A649VRI1_9CAUD|nr:hypothetical protein KIP53_gp066 [Mycobacterium phage Blinn1]QGJ94804.1 hypothetical protein SEA_BLINN1_43 [Mycobacterium phage Blinn1]
MTEYTSPDVVVTDRAVFFDGQELPWHIAKDGISFKPGGHDDINTLTVDFFVNNATFLGTDPNAAWVVFEGDRPPSWRASHMTRWAQIEVEMYLAYYEANVKINKTMKEYRL